MSRGSEKAAAALAAGALDAIAKDDLDLHDPAGTMGVAFRHRVRVLAQARVIRHPRVPAGHPARRPGPRRTGRLSSASAPRVGGPELLMFLLSALPADYPIPLLIVQHMAAGFTDGLVRWLDRAVAIPVRVADRRDARPPPGPGSRRTARI